jgi:hypothetical protein
MLLLVGRGLRAASTVRRQHRRGHTVRARDHARKYGDERAAYQSSPGALYPALRRLVERGLLRVEDEVSPTGREAGLSLRAIADLAGCSASAVCRELSRNKNPRIGGCCSLAYNARSDAWSAGPICRSFG